MQNLLRVYIRIHHDHIMKRLHQVRAELSMRREGEGLWLTTKEVIPDDANLSD